VHPFREPVEKTRGVGMRFGPGEADGLESEVAGRFAQSLRQTFRCASIGS
jgi:hypothetical protein